MFTIFRLIFHGFGAILVFDWKIRKEVSDMMFNTISINNRGKGFNDAVEETKKVAEINGLNDKQSLQLQLCTEELLSMARSITGEMEACF